MAIVYSNDKIYRNLQEQVLKNAQDIEILKEKPSLKIIIVEELPETGEEGILYLVPKNPDPDTGDADSYDEYVWLSESETYELVGTTAIDLQNLTSPIYVTTENKPEGLSYGLRITNNGWTSDLQQEGGAKLELTGTAVNVTGNLITSGQVVIGATGYDIKKDSTNLVIEADGNPVKVRGTLLPNTGGTYDLGNVSTKWNGVYTNQLNFGDNATINKDSSNRVNINNGGDAKLKIGASETICKGSFSPDQDGMYALGRSALRWTAVYASSLANDYSALQIRGKTGVNISCDNGSAIRPSTDSQIDLGTSSAKWRNVYIDNLIRTDLTPIPVDIIATKPDYDTPDVWASGTLGSGTGQDTIDLSIVGMPDDGLYMFTYGNAQCFIALTSTMIQNASLYPMRCPCPVLEESGGSIEGNTGNLKISRNSDILTIQVASTITGSATSTNGWGWQLIKVM